MQQTQQPDNTAPIVSLKIGNFKEFRTVVLKSTLENSTLQDEYDKTYEIFTALNDAAPPNAWKMTPSWLLTILVTEHACSAPGFLTPCDNLAARGLLTPPWSLRSTKDCSQDSTILNK